MNLDTIALIALAVSALLAWVAAKAAYRIGRRIVRRASARLVDRAVDAVLFVLLFRWLRRDAGVVRPPALEGDDIYRVCLLSAWNGDPGACRWCDRPLPRRAKRYCRAQCRITARTNHEFPLARDAALERDEHTCVRPRCGAVATYERALEVNHIEMAHGRHDQPGCIHHLTNLESLCGRHHDEVTAGQRARGWTS